MFEPYFPILLSARSSHHAQTHTAFPPPLQTLSIRLLATLQKLQAPVSRRPEQIIGTDGPKKDSQIQLEGPEPRACCSQVKEPVLI